MARTTAASASRRKTAVVSDEPVGLELVGVFLTLTGVLLVALLATLAPENPDGTADNLVGSAGHALGSLLTRGFGLGAWILPLFGLAWGIRCLRGRAPARLGLRLLMLPVLTALVSIGAALLFDTLGLPGISRSGPGGYFGVAMGRTLFDLTGRASILVVLGGSFAVLRLLTDVDLRPVGRWIMEAATMTTAAPVKEDDEALDDEYEYEDEEDEEDPDGYGDAEYEEEEGDDEEYEYEELEDDEEWEDEEVEAPVAKKLTKAEKAAAKKAEKAKAKAGKEAEKAAERKARKPAPIVTNHSRRPTTPRAERLEARGEYKIPPLELLMVGQEADEETIREEVAANVHVLEETLASFGVEARVVSSLRGPVITFCEIKVPSGIRLSRVTALADDLAIALKAPSIRIVAPIPGRSTVGIEVPNLQRDMVCLRDLLEEAGHTLERKAVPIMLGRDTAGRAIVEDLATMPHALIAGATGSGKSVCINSVLLSVLFTRGPDEINLILIDPKQVELSFYEGIPHLLTPVVTDMRRAAKILEWAVDRMEERYAKLLAAGVRNIAGYNKVKDEKKAQIRERTGMTEEELPNFMPYLVIVVDELADLMLTMGKEVELAITRLAQKSRAVGIHLILATQRPSTNVITGLIKANMPSRLAFTVSSKIDSRVILDANGADKLLGKGDMLYMHPRSLHVRRAQGTLVSDDEARETVEFLKEQYPEPEYEDLLAKKPGEMGDPLKEDDLYDDAVRAVLSSKLGSASMLQRRMGIGYTRASRLIDMMCDRDVVGPHVGSKAREVLYELEEWEGLQADASPRPSEQFDPTDPPCVDESWD